MTVPEFSIFHKSTCLLLAIFRKFIFNQKEKIVPGKKLFQNLKNIKRNNSILAKSFKIFDT